jgi:hypothetical protein
MNPDVSSRLKRFSSPTTRLHRTDPHGSFPSCNPFNGIVYWHGHKTQRQRTPVKGRILEAVEAVEA